MRLLKTLVGIMPGAGDIGLFIKAEGISCEILSLILVHFSHWLTLIVVGDINPDLGKYFTSYKIYKSRHVIIFFLPK